MPEDRSEVTSVIRHTVRKGRHADYEAWLQRIVPTASKATGHRGVNVIRPPAGSNAYTTVIHFDTLDNLRLWLDSDVRHRLIDDALPLLIEEDQVEIKTGLEFWFTPPAGRHAARPYKQFLVTLSVIYPLTLIVPPLLRPLLRQTTLTALPYVGQFVIDAVVVGLITFVIMPRYVRLLAKWLYS